MLISLSMLMLLNVPTIAQTREGLPPIATFQGQFATPALIVDDNYLMFGDASVAPHTVFSMNGRTFIQLANIRATSPSIFAITPVGYVPIKPNFEMPYLSFEGIEQEFVLMYSGQRHVLIRHGTVGTKPPTSLAQILFKESSNTHAYAVDELLGKGRGEAQRIVRETERLKRERDNTALLQEQLQQNMASAAALQQQTTRGLADLRNQSQGVLQEIQGQSQRLEAQASIIQSQLGKQREETAKENAQQLANLSQQLQQAQKELANLALASKALEVAKLEFDKSKNQPASRPPATAQSPAPTTATKAASNQALTFKLLASERNLATAAKRWATEHGYELTWHASELVQLERDGQITTESLDAALHQLMAAANRRGFSIELIKQGKQYTVKDKQS